jgi:hypothetical protein
MTDEPKREFFTRVRPLITQFAIDLQEKHGLSVADVADSFMSAAVAISVGVSGRERTCVHLGAIAAAVASGRYDDAVTVETSALN